MDSETNEHNDKGEYDCGAMEKAMKSSSQRDEEEQSARVFSYNQKPPRETAITAMKYK